MAIIYPPKVVYRPVRCDTKANFMDDLAAVLSDAGWTVNAVGGTSTLTFTGTTISTESVTINGLTYTFVATLTQATPRQVKNGATKEECASNLQAAITAGAGSGTAYSSSTTAHPTCTATLSTPSAVTITTLATGGAAAGGSITEGLNNATLSNTSLSGAGYKCDTAVTPQGLRARMQIYDPGGVQVYLYALDVPEAVLNRDGVRIQPVAGRQLECRAHPYGVMAWLYGSTGNDTTQVFFEVPHIRDTLAAPVIEEISDGGGVWRIKTATPHKARTGMRASIASGSEATGYRGAIGQWAIRVLDDTSFTLNKSVYNPDMSYDGQARAGIREADTISVCYWMVGNQYVQFASFSGTFRTSLVTQHGVTNLNYMETTAAAATPVEVMTNVRAPDFNRYDNWGPYSDLLEARVGWKVGGGGGPYHKIGDFWGAMVINRPTPVDIEKTDFDGHDWINLTGNNYAYGGLWVTKT